MTAKKFSVLIAAVLMTLSASLYAAERVPRSTTPLLSAEETADLTFMREEEKMARDVYLVLYDKWDLDVFSNIASSEQKHMDAILKLLKKYKLTDPAANTLIGQFTNADLQELYNSLVAKGLLTDLDALLVGGIIEETDMRDIMHAIDRSQQADIDSVYENLLCGSRNHLRAFALGIEAITKRPYAAQVLYQEEVDEILSSPMEQCGDIPLL